MLFSELLFQFLKNVFTAPTMVVYSWELLLCVFIYPAWCVKTSLWVLLALNPTVFNIHRDPLFRFVFSQSFGIRQSFPLSEQGGLGWSSLPEGREGTQQLLWTRKFGKGRLGGLLITSWMACYPFSWYAPPVCWSTEDTSGCVWTQVTSDRLPALYKPHFVPCQYWNPTFESDWT